jgi:hypothetical protein
MSLMNPGSPYAAKLLLLLLDVLLDVLLAAASRCAILPQPALSLPLGDAAHISVASACLRACMLDLWLALTNALSTCT